MVTAAIFLSAAMVWLDLHLPGDWSRDLPYLFFNQPDGARSLLATVAGSMITVAGVTFSLTLLAVSHATGQFGPRLLNNFMRDRGNQITLGTFVATFIYCLLVLRTIRTSTERPQVFDPNHLDAFVPHLSISLGVILALCSVGVLIFFIHHVPESIRLSHVVSDVGKQLCDSIEELFPESVGVAADPQETLDQKTLYQQIRRTGKAITLTTSGYVQSVDTLGVMELAQQEDVTIYLNVRPGDFYCGRTPLAWVSSSKFPEVAETRLSSMFALGNHRTLSQNSLFAVDQLVQVAQRALSPGVNDPQSATECLDWLKTGLLTLAHREPMESLRYDDQDNLRVFTRDLGFDDFCERVFDQLRQYVAADRHTSFHMMRVLVELTEQVPRDEQKRLLHEHAQRLMASTECENWPAQDREELLQLLKQCTVPTEDPA